MGFYKFVKRLIEENNKKRAYRDKLKRQIKEIDRRINNIEDLEEV